MKWTRDWPDRPDPVEWGDGYAEHYWAYIAPLKLHAPNFRQVWLVSAMLDDENAAILRIPLLDLTIPWRRIPRDTLWMPIERPDAPHDPERIPDRDKLIPKEPTP